jgi:hypothetical protein
MPLSPPLLVAPTVPLTEDERKTFEVEVADIGSAEPGDVVSVPFPVVLYHRIEGVWIPVSDLGSFQTTHVAPEVVDEESD